MTLFSMTGTTLHDALANVLPHTSKDGTTPVLTAVQVTVDDEGLVTFVGTDRYTLAVADVASDDQAPLEPGTFLVPRDVAMAVAKLAKAAKNYAVTVAADETAYTVEVRGFDQSTTARLEIGEFPKWRSLWPQDEPVDVSRIGLGASHLAKFAKVYRDGAALKLPTLDCTFHGANKPVVIDVVGVELRALFMTTRLVGASA